MKKQNIILIGLMGVGKSSVGKVLAKELHLRFYDSDSEIEKRSGASVAWIFDLEGESGFRERETKMVDELTQLNSIVLATGGGVVLNPVNRKIMHERGVVIYLRASLDDLVERTGRNQNRPLLLKDEPGVVLKKLLEFREPLYLEIADLIYDTSGRTVTEITNQIINDLQQKHLF